MKNLPRNSFSTSFMSFMKVLGALVSPKGINNHWYNISLVLKVAFHSSPSLMWILWFPLFTFIFVKCIAPLKQSKITFILGNQNLYVIMIFLIGHKFLHIIHSQLLFGTDILGTRYRLRLFWIKPFYNNSCTFLFNSSLFASIIMGAFLLGKITPIIKYIWWVIFCTGGNLSVTLPKTISRNSYNISATVAGTSSTFSLPSFGIIEKQVYSCLIPSRNFFT